MPFLKLRLHAPGLVFQEWSSLPFATHLGDLIYGDIDSFIVEDIRSARGSIRQRTMMRSVRSRWRLKRIRKGSCLLDRHVETSEETRSVKGRSGGPDWLEADLCLLGPSRCGGPALGLGGDAGSSPRSVRDHYAG